MEQIYKKRMDIDLNKFKVIRIVLPKPKILSLSVSKIRTDYASIHSNPINGIKVVVENLENLNVWNVLFGKLHSPLEDELCEAVLTFPKNYPDDPATIQFITKMFHPNIDFAGFPIQDALSSFDGNPKSKFDLRSLFFEVLDLLQYPKNQLNCLSTTLAAQLFSLDRAKYETNRKNWNTLQNTEMASFLRVKLELEFFATVKKDIADCLRDDYRLQNPRRGSNRLAVSPSSGEISPYTQRRLLLELRGLENNEASKGISGGPIEENILIWRVSIPAPNGKFLIATVVFDNNYPTTFPMIFFETPIFHPNISPKDGRVCLQSLENEKGNWTWTPAHTIWSLLGSIQVLLSEPNAIDPVNEIAAEVLLQNPYQYKMMLHECFENGMDYPHQIENLKSVQSYEMPDNSAQLENEFAGLSVSTD